MKKYLVGGSVRDQLLGREISDLDWVVVGATHDEMIAAGFERVGADFPVYLHPDSKQEYALARTERKSGKGYLGFEVNFDPTITLEQDLERRDLTINSIAMERDTEGYQIIDPFNGRQDLKDKVLRHTSQAFAEDPLRVIRLARFYARFEDFTIAMETVDLAAKLVDSGELEHLSRERFWAEMEKCFKQTNRIDRFFEALDIFGVLDKVSFFKDVFGDKTWATRIEYRAALAARLHGLEPEIALPIFVAITASSKAEQKSQVIPARVKKLTLNMRAVRTMVSDRKAEKILGLFKANRAFTKGGEIGVLDLITAVHVADCIGEKLPVTAMELQIALNYASAITGINYQHLDGPEIGKAMDKARLEAIELSLK